MNDPAQSYALIIKAFQAALEHVPPHTRDLLASGAQPHITVVQKHLAPPEPAL